MNEKTKGAIIGGSIVMILLVAVGATLATITNNGNGTWTFSYTVNNAQAARITTAFAETYHYQANITQPNGTVTTNPQTKAQFTEEKIKGYIQEVVVAYELEQAKKAVATPTAPDVN